MNLQGGLFWTPTPNPLLDPYGTHFMHDSHQFNYHIVSCTATALSLNIHILFKGNPTSKRCVWMRRPNYHQIPCFQVFIIVKPFHLYQLYKFVHRSLWLRGSKCGLLVFPGIIYSTGLINERYLCACFTDCLSILCLSGVSSSNFLPRWKNYRKRTPKGKKLYFVVIVSKIILLIIYLIFRWS